MTRKSIDELVVGAARGEPMDVDERERLAAALASSPELRESLQAQRALTAELAALRAVLQPPPGSRADEERLREAFRAAARRRGAARLVRPRAWAASLAAALAALVIVVAAFERSPVGRDGIDASTASRTGDAIRIELAAPAPGAAAGNAALPAGAAPAVFYSLPYAPGLSLAGSYSLVRVRIPLASFAAGDGGQVEASVEADVLIGDDGIPSAIHFADHGTLLVSKSSD